MTFTTLFFNADKKNGLVHKAGKAAFFDGNRAMERTLYYDESDNRNYVILGGEAHCFHAYSTQDVAGITKGHI